MNGFAAHNAHDALGDVEATIHIARQIAQRVLSQILLEIECGHRPDIIMLRAQQTAEMR
jgi:exonuclease I